MKKSTFLVATSILLLAIYVPIKAFLAVPNLIARGVSEAITISALSPSFLKWFGLNASVLGIQNGHYRFSFISFSTNVYSQMYVYINESNDVVIAYNSECRLFSSKGDVSYIASNAEDGSYLFNGDTRDVAHMCRFGADKRFSYFGRFELSSYKYGPTISKYSKWVFVGNAE